MPTGTPSQRAEAPPRRKLRKAHRVHVIEERCKGCRFCIAFCPRNVLELSSAFNEKGYHPPRVKDHDLCSGCQMCYLRCPEFAIWVEAQERTDGGRSEER